MDSLCTQGDFYCKIPPDFNPGSRPNAAGVSSIINLLSEAQKEKILLLEMSLYLTNISNSVTENMAEEKVKRFYFNCMNPDLILFLFYLCLREFSVIIQMLDFLYHVLFWDFIDFFLFLRLNKCTALIDK